MTFREVTDNLTIISGKSILIVIVAVGFAIIKQVIN